jgi:hypothetical protein
MTFEQVDRHGDALTYDIGPSTVSRGWIFVVDQRDLAAKKNHTPRIPVRVNETQS